jgi:hypothetical protein
MSPQRTTPAKRRGSPARRTKRRAGLPRWLLWWPFVLALVATPFAVRAASVLALSGPGALRLLYPFVVLIQAHAPGHLAPEQRDTLAEWTMWAQFPLYGLLAVLVARWRGIVAGLVTVLVLHAAAAAAAFVLSQ